MQNFVQHDKCSFCKTEQETLCRRFLFFCRHSNMLWINCEQYYLTITKEFHALCLREVIGITMSKCSLSNYLILIGKLYIYGIAVKEALRNIEGFKLNTKLKNIFPQRTMNWKPFMKNGQKTFLPFN